MQEALRREHRYTKLACRVCVGNKVCRGGGGEWVGEHIRRQRRGFMTVHYFVGSVGATRWHKESNQQQQQGCS